MKTETIPIHAGKEHNPTSALVTPIFQTSTYLAGDDLEAYAERATATSAPDFYHRHGDPVGNQAAQVIAELEGKATGLLCTSGMGAISTAVLAAVKAGDHVVAQHTHYAAASKLVREVLPRFGVEVSLVDQTDRAAFAAAVKPNTRLFYLESPVNPSLALTDLTAVSALAKQHGIRTICDNTFAGPLVQRPHDFGIDVVVHSATKTMGGHSDLIAGAIAADADFIRDAWRMKLALGTSLGAFDAWLLLRGLRTLPLRIERINANAAAVARYLECHATMDRVLSCALPSHPQHELVQRQMKGGTGMIAVHLRGTDDADRFNNARTVVTSVKLFAHAASLGGVESLISHPASMWGTNLSEEQRRTSGIGAGMLRISVGIEHADDLITDLEQALARIA